jgi:hypothetical protein
MKYKPEYDEIRQRVAEEREKSVRNPHRREPKEKVTLSSILPAVSSHKADSSETVQ